MHIGRDIILNAIGIALCIASASIQAQPMSAGARQGLYLEQQRLNEWKAQQQQQADWQAQQRAQAQWQARENAIQAQIAKYRATPYYGTLIIQGETNHIGWGGGGYVTKELAEKKALEAACTHSSCSILITIASTCAGVARPDWATNGQYWIVATDTNPKRAVEKAYYACEQKHGQGNCIYAKNPNTPQYFDTYCSGYDYEAYGQKN
ncbi:MAG: hypothetical protein Q4G70_09775 [Pseudomonadota bacterium]|nr:hypothetical protein [Pseudomonadota bacterium]